MNQINLQDRSGLPDHLRDGTIAQPERWLILTKDGRKVAELPLEDLNGLSSKDLEYFFTIQEEDGREYHIGHR